MKRIFLFLATNMAIVLVLSVTMRLLGVEPYLLSLIHISEPTRPY